LCCSIVWAVNERPVKIWLRPYPIFSKTQKRWRSARKIIHCGAVRREPEWLPGLVPMELPLTGAQNSPAQVQSSWLILGIRTSQKEDPPTFVVVGDSDGIASASTMERRVNSLRSAGVDVEFHIYRNVGHGFGLGIGTNAEGWLDDAARFGKITCLHDADSYGFELE